MQRGLVEPPVVVDPPPDHGVEHPCQVREGLVGPQVQPPAADLPPHPGAGLVADRRCEADEASAGPAADQPWAERVAEEVEPLVLMGAPPVIILAVHDGGLGLVQLQAARRQPDRDGVPDLPGLLLAGAVHDDIVAVAFEPDVREGPGHPGIERVVQEDVGEQG